MAAGRFSKQQWAFCLWIFSATIVQAAYSPNPRLQPRSPPPRRLLSTPPTPRASSLPPRPLPSATSMSTICRMSLVGGSSPSSSMLQEASLACSSGSAPVNVTVGRQLLGLTYTWTGVNVSLRRGDEEWGLTFHNVPYLRLVDSVIRDLPLSRGPIVQCENCTKLEIHNVNVSDIWLAGNDTAALHGPLHATNLSYAALSDFSCSGVHDAHGWACIMLQYNVNTTAKRRLKMTNCTFAGNSVAKGGLYGTVSTVNGARGAGASPAGHGAVVVAASAASSRTDNQPASSSSDGNALEVSMFGVMAHSNAGGKSAFFSSLDLPMSSITVSGCSFVDNTAAGDGGVFNLAAALNSFTATDKTRFWSNTAEYGNGGALAFSEGPASLNITGGSSFRHNRAEAGSGGAIHVFGHMEVLTISGAATQLTDNVAGLHGGAIMMRTGVPAMRVQGGVLLANNTARKGNGGALCLMVDEVVADASLEISASRLTGNRAGLSGGALYLGPTDMSSMVRRTDPTSRVGHVGGGAEVWSASIMASELSYNRAGSAGGAMLASATGASALSVSISGSKFVSNGAGDESLAEGERWCDGGAVALTGLLDELGDWTPVPVPPRAPLQDNLVAEGSDAEDYLAASWDAAVRRSAGACTAAIQGSSFEGGSSGGSGGALFFRLCTARVEDCSFKANAANLSGGAVAAAAADPASSGPPGAPSWHSLVINQSSFSWNTAARADGGAVAVAMCGAVGMYGCNLTANSAMRNGGAVAALQPPESAAAAAAAMPYWPFEAGGSRSSLELVSCSIDSNNASANGGGVYAGSLAALRVVSSSVVHNAAANNGGGIAALASAALAHDPETAALARVTVEDSNLTSNGCDTGSGGGMYLTLPVAASLTRVVLSGNAARLYGDSLAALPAGLGGSGSSTLVLKDCAYVGEVDGRGSGTYTSGDVVVTELHDNSGAEDAGVGGGQ